MLRQIAKQLSRVADLNTITKRNLCITQKLRNKEAEAETSKPTQVERGIVVDKDKNITLIGINRPYKRNAINADTASQLCEAFRNFEEDETSPVAVLYGVGESFCSGFDILELSAESEQEVSIDILMMPEGSVGPTRRILKKPVVCGINGFCIANGLELALMCDLRVMEETAVLGFFNRRFGVPVIDGGTARLPAIVGISRALDLILTGRQVDAVEAESMGIANRIVPQGEALNKALQLAKTLAKFPQGALNHDRNSLYTAAFDSSSFHASMQNEIMYTSKEIIEDMQKGIKWFNKTFTQDTSHSWLKREKSMADWDDEEVADAAACIEEEKQAAKAALIAAEKEALEAKEREKAMKKALKEAHLAQEKQEADNERIKTEKEALKKEKEQTDKKDEPKK